MITLFPIAIWRAKSLDASGPNGTNWPFFCWANRNHPFAAAIMAQEIYESRFKTVRLVTITTILMALAGAASTLIDRSPSPIDIAVVGMFCLAIAALFVGLFLKWQREAELRGQAIECEVIAGLYHGDEVAAVQAAAEQLTGYSQFRGMNKKHLIIELNERQPFAYKWCKANQHMIKKAKQQAQELGS